MSDVIDISRHESVFNPAEFNYPCHIIGAGATGSRVFAALVELGMKQISVYDDDIIEEHNLANQIYTGHDVGLAKVEGCMKFVQRKLGIGETAAIPAEFRFIQRKVTDAYLASGESMQGGIVFILTDTMESRRIIFDALESRCRRASTSPGMASAAPLLIIETRMGSTHGSIFTINPFDVAACKEWRSTLVDDTDPNNIELSPCGTTLSVGTTASLIANYAVWQMKNFFVNPVGLHPRIDLFFKPTLTITSPARQWRFELVGS